MSFCSVAAYSLTGIITSPKEIAPFHMLCMMSPYPPGPGTPTSRYCLNSTVRQCFR